ncbi:EamA family transporter [Pedobacter sp.]
MALIYQLCSILGFTIGNNLWHKPVQKLPITFIIALKSMITSCLFLMAIIFVSWLDPNNQLDAVQPLNRINLSAILYACGLCAISFWGLYFFNQSLKHTASGISITVSGMGTIIGFLIAFFVYGEKITSIHIASSILGTFGLWCMEKLNPAFFKFQFTKGMLFGLLSMLFWRIGGLFPIAIDKVGVLFFSLLLEITVFSISLILLLASRKFKAIKLNLVKTYVFIITCIALTNFAGILGSHLALKNTSLANYTILGFLSPIVTFSISLFIYKEKYTSIQYLGILIIIFGGLALSHIVKLF